MARLRAKAPWQQRVKPMLAEGLGVEDIAIAVRQPVESVRMMVRMMRQSGILAEIYGGKK